MPLGCSLVVIGLLKELFDPWVDLIHLSSVGAGSF
jgi:hypothetical protein